MSKTKITAFLEASTFKSFSNLVKELGLRRDAYLSNLLPNEIAELRSVKPNSEKGLEFLMEQFGFTDFPMFEQKEFARVSLTLETEAASEMDKVCSEKRIPRDLFLTSVLEYAVNALDRAAVYISDPHAGEVPDTGADSFYSHLAISDRDVDYYREALEHDVKICAAIAAIKGISDTAAVDAFFKLDEKQKEKIRQNPKVLKKLRDLDGSSEREWPEGVSLDDLLENLESTASEDL